MRGNAAKAASFVQRLATDPGSSSQGPSGYLAHSQPTHHPVPSVAPSIAFLAAQEVEPSTPPSRYETRQRSRLAHLLLGWLLLCLPLQEGGQPTSAFRGPGRLESGQVQSVKDGWVVQTGHRPLTSGYAVVRGPNIDAPKIYKSSRELFVAVGQLEGSDTICHGFPSKAETQVYLAGAGMTRSNGALLALPELQMPTPWILELCRTKFQFCRGQLR